MNAPDPDRVPLIADELDELHAIAGLSAQRIIELGCGPAQMARKLVRRFPGCSVAALEIDAVQHRTGENAEFIVAADYPIRYKLDGVERRIVRSVVAIRARAMTMVDRNVLHREAERLGDRCRLGILFKVRCK